MATREALIDATKDLLAEGGYVRTSPRKILERSGAGQGSLYHHFKGKSDLAAAALEEVSGEMRVDADRLLEDPDPIVAISSWLAAPRDALRGCRLGRLVAEPILDEPAITAPISAYFRHIESVLADRVAEARRAGRLSAGLEPADVAAALVAVVQGGYVLARSTGDAEAMRRAQRAAIALLHVHSTDEGNAR